jgi:pimeloyl-ACP methyl ester carboxylesterase
VQNLMTAVLLSGPWKVAGWTMFYKTLYPTRKPDDFDEYLDKMSANMREPGRFDALKGLGFSPKTASEERIGRVQTSSLVVMGTKDPDWPDPEAEGRWIVDHLSGSSLLLVEDAGHYPQTEMPEEVIPGLLDFLNQVS